MGKKANESMQNFEYVESSWSKLKNYVKRLDKNFLSLEWLIDEKWGHSIPSGDIVFHLPTGGRITWLSQFNIFNIMQKSNLAP